MTGILIVKIDVDELKFKGQVVIIKLVITSKKERMIGCLKSQKKN